MARMTNDAAGLPPHMRAVFYRQFARDAEYLAHKCTTSETRESYRRLAELWRSLGDEMDAASECANGTPIPVQPLHLSSLR